MYASGLRQGSARREGKEGAAPLRVLVVEDQALIALALMSDLAALGFGVVGRAASGEDAIAMAECHMPDLVLLDVHLIGDMNGIEAAGQIKAATGAEIAFLTAYADGPYRSHMAELEPLAILGKPYELDQLAAIRANLAARGAWAQRTVYR